MMKNMRRAVLVLALACLGLAIPSVSKADEQVDSTLALIKKNYGKVRDLTARFDLETRVKSAGRSEKAAGLFRYKATNRMRWDYDDPAGKMIVSDGTTLWMVLPEEKKVYKQSALSAFSGMTPFEFLFGATDPKSEFKISMEKDTGASPAEAAPAAKAGDARVLRLEPKTPSPAFSWIRIKVDGKTGVILSSELADVYGNLTITTFSKTQTNTGLSDGLFNYKPAPGYEVQQAQ